MVLNTFIKGHTSRVKDALRNIFNNGNLPDPDELALEIVENLEAGLESFRAIITSLNKN